MLYLSILGDAGLKDYGKQLAHRILLKICKQGTADPADYGYTSSAAAVNLVLVHAPNSIIMGIENFTLTS